VLRRGFELGGVIESNVNFLVSGAHLGASKQHRHVDAEDPLSVAVARKMSGGGRGHPVCRKGDWRVERRKVGDGRGAIVLRQREGVELCLGRARQEQTKEQER
jgi:hypothetical protein